MMTLSDWLTSIAPEQFLEEHFQKAPHAEPGSARSAIPLMTWDKVAALVSSPSRPDLIVAKEGRFLSGMDPSSADEARTLFEGGCSIVMRNLERHDDALRGLAASFRGSLLEGEVQVHVFATPVRALGFGWHYDCEDVFIAQTAGVKEYFLRKNTVNPEPTLDTMPRDMQFERETSPLVATTLAAGDWLYIPRGWWHRGRGLDDCLSISIGVLSPAAAGK